MEVAAFGRPYMTSNKVSPKPKPKRKFKPKPKPEPKPKRVMDPVYNARYEKALAYLSTRESSYTILYEPHLIKDVNTNKKRKTNNIYEAKPPKPTKATPKKISEKFLTSVKTLTQSGMLDGVAVRYISKTKQIELPGKIQGPSYLCGCQSCNFTQTISASEFEVHAGCKTSHPNNHIHFENGKSMHSVVMELNGTPETSLFDALHTLTGSSIDHKAFSAWKASFN